MADHQAPAVDQTAQQLMDRYVHHFRAQPRCHIGGRDVYWDPATGRRCPIGACIPAPWEYPLDPADTTSPGDLVDRFPELGRWLLPVDLAPEVGEDLVFRVGEVHDRAWNWRAYGAGLGPSGWEDLAQVAREFGLVYRGPRVSHRTGGRPRKFL